MNFNKVISKEIGPIPQEVIDQYVEVTAVIGSDDGETKTIKIVMPKTMFDDDMINVDRVILDAQWD